MVASAGRSVVGSDGTPYDTAFGGAYEAEIWRGIRPLEASIATSELLVEAESDLQRAFPSWLMLSVFAATKRRRS